ncbi:hypothetical protein JCM3775_004469 [Rhodotorula graminis]
MKALPSLGTSSSTASSPPPRPATTASALVSSTTPPASEEPSPTDLLLATPPTLLKLFALSAPVIHASATFVQLVTWTHPSFFGSLLVLLSWWAVCLFGYAVAVYGLNAALLVLVLHKYLAAARKTGKGAPAPSLRHRQRNVTLSPAAYAQLVNSAHVLAEHVQSFRTEVVHPLSAHFSLTPLRPSTPAPAYDTAWFLVTSYPFYLALTFFVPVRYLFLLVGTVGILWQAPFFATLRALLWRSAFVRWVCRLGVGVLRGGKGVQREWGRTRTGLGIPGLVGAQVGALGGGRQRGEPVVEEKPVKKPRSSSVGLAGGASPPASPPLAAAAQASSTVAVRQEKAAEAVALEEEAAVDEGEDVQVQFTVFENQRWWVGLDWTHALLPGERASWTDPDNNPANPPASFVLPPPSVAYVASPTKADPHSRLKKTTEWRWLDPEWHVLRSAVASVALPVGGAGGGAAVAPDGSQPALANPPSPTFSRTLGQIAASAVTGASHSSSTSLSTSPSLSLLSSHVNSQAPSSPSFVSPSSTDLSYADSPLFAAWSVDDEGWQYGDNHFEKMGPRGGLGKYTRRRAWVRRAGLVERTERVPGAATAATAGGSASTAPAAGSTALSAGAGTVLAVKKDATASARDERRSGASPRRRSASGSRPATGAAGGGGGSSALRSGSSSGARKRTSMLVDGGGEGASAGGG